MQETSRIAEILGGQRLLGLRMPTWDGLAERIRFGLPYASLESLRLTLDISRAELSTFLALPQRTLARRKKAHKLHVDESDRLFRLARIAARAVEVLGGKDKAARWLRQRNRALGDATPLSQLDTDIGVRWVEQVLGRIEHGVFS